MNMIVFVFVLGFIGLSTCTPVQFKDCGSKNGIVHMVDIDPCPKQPCELALNSNVTAKVDFQSKIATNSLTLQVQAILYGYPQYVDVPDPNACDLGVKCPIKAGDHNVMTLQTYVEPDSPTETMGIQLELQDDSYNDVVCAEVPVTIIPGQGKDKVLRFRPRP